jgi:2-polyprenyl-6-methoxyphenol hydroxylase-like FAD-dependent oxidoreductase
MENSPVVIVGAGPSGLMLGLSLAKHGVHVRLILLITPLSQS